MFRKSEHRPTEHIRILNGEPLEIVKKYNYVGLIVSNNDSWSNAKEVCRKAIRAIFALWSNMKKIWGLAARIIAPFI